MFEIYACKNENGWYINRRGEGKSEYLHAHGKWYDTPRYLASRQLALDLADYWNLHVVNEYDEPAFHTEYQCVPPIDPSAIVRWINEAGKDYFKVSITNEPNGKYQKFAEYDEQTGVVTLVVGDKSWD